MWSHQVIGLWVVFDPLSTRLVAIVRWGKSASAWWVVELLFSLSGSCIALQLQLCLVSSSPSKVRQLSFECCPQSQNSALGSTSCPTCLSMPAVSLCGLLDLHWVLVAPLGDCLVTTPLLSAFPAVPAFHWEFSSLSHSHSQGQVQHSTTTSTVSVRLHLAIYIFQFSSCGGSVYPGAALYYFPQEWVGESHVVCDAHLFILQIHAGWQEEMASPLSVWCGIGRLSIG
jgi:hypothetical protein